MMPLAVMAVPRSGATHHQDWGKASDVERIGRALHDSMAKKTYPRGPSQATSAARGDASIKRSRGSSAPLCREYWRQSYDWMGPA
jgi:hypothetical protein